MILRTTTSAYLADAGVVRAVVHAEAEPPTPASIRVDGRWWSDERFLAPDAAVSIEGGVLRTGRYRIVLEAAGAWTTSDPSPGGRPVAPPTAGLLVGPDPRSGGLAERVDAVLDALEGLDRPDGGDEPGAALGAALDRLVGFGRGLTPAGDDALVGLLAVLWRSGDPAAVAHRRRLSEAVAPRLGHTSIFGRFHLEHALAGYFGAAVMAVLDALTEDAVDHRREPSTALAAATAQLLGLGATSGADTLIGMAAALSRWGHPPRDARAYVRRPVPVGGVR